MWKRNEAHFADDYPFKDQAFATGTDAQVSEAFELGCTNGGIRVRGWVEGSAVCASGDTIKTELEVAGTPDATSWKKIAENTVTASTTSLTGDVFSFIPDIEPGDADGKYMRVKVANATGMTGNFTVAVELVP